MREVKVSLTKSPNIPYIVVEGVKYVNMAYVPYDQFKKRQKEERSRTQ